ncbi:hypothetical protein QE152_g41275, partial [Popillia japonica]
KDPIILAPQKTHQTEIFGGYTGNSCKEWGPNPKMLLSNEGVVVEVDFGEYTGNSCKEWGPNPKMLLSNEAVVVEVEQILENPLGEGLSKLPEGCSNFDAQISVIFTKVLKVRASSLLAILMNKLT